MQPNKERYEQLLEDLTVAVKSLSANCYGLTCEINHLRTVIEKAENSVNIGAKPQIEKRS